MKIRIAFLGQHQASGIGWGDRKFEIYFAHLSEVYVQKYFVYVTTDPTQLQETWERVVLLEKDIIQFLQTHHIDYVYFAWAKIGHNTHQAILQKSTGLINVNFTPCYDPSGKHINLIISKTDYWKLKRMHGELINAYVVYNPIDVDNRTKLAKVSIGTHRTYFTDKKYLIGRLGRAEPSKWHFLIIATLLQLQKKKVYDYGFIFAGMPRLYRKILKLLLNKRMYASLLFLPELRKLEDITTFYASIDLFWQTSWIGESFWNVIAESYCFGVPVITDFKHFYRNGKVHEAIYDAQTELVDHGVTWGYCRYPKQVINFLESHARKQLQHLGQAWYAKAHAEYHIQKTDETLVRILYDIGLKDWKYAHDNAFEQLVATPSSEEVEEYATDYARRMEIAERVNTPSRSDKMQYQLLHTVWRWVEYAYLLVRKSIRLAWQKDIERF
jgi:glycosyltransferase involved in cell wall biosynthesis